MENGPANPIIIDKGQPSPSTSGGKNSWKKHLPKLIFGALILFILIELIFAFRALKPNSSQNISNLGTQLRPLSGGQMSLVVTDTDVKVGDIVPVSVRIFTGGHPTAGADLVLNYDPEYLEASGSSFFKAGDVYPDFPIINADPINKMILISGITSLSQSGFNGAGTFGTLNFKAVKNGKTKLTIDFTKDRTTDSNIIESNTAKDILDEVTNAEVNIKQ